MRSDIPSTWIMDLSDPREDPDQTVAMFSHGPKEKYATKSTQVQGPYIRGHPMTAAAHTSLTQGKYTLMEENERN